MAGSAVGVGFGHLGSSNGPLQSKGMTNGFDAQRGSGEPVLITMQKTK